MVCLACNFPFQNESRVSGMLLKLLKLLLLCLCDDFRMDTVSQCVTTGCFFFFPVWHQTAAASMREVEVAWWCDD